MSEPTSEKGMAQKFWDQFYKDSPFKHGKNPSPFLVEMAPRLQKGKVLDVAMGEGANAVFLAQHGMTVKGFDISSVAVERALALAKEKNVSIDAKPVDMDLHLMGLMEYDSIVMMYFKPSIPRYYSEMMRGLKQGGTLLIHSYSTEEMTEPLGIDDGYKNYFFRSNELLYHLRGMRILFYNEGRSEGKNVIQCLAQKPLDKDAAKYNLFSDMQSQSGEKPKNAQMNMAEALFKKK